jgi:8-oxo-dGTP pyrophosphatase MutT (NUDIX family)
MGGAWVFPGGAVDAGDGEDDAAHRVAAVRELREEAGIVLGDPQALVAYSRWIAPRELVTRFDTRFYVAPLPAGQEPRVDGQETVDLRWLTPQAALRSYADGELPLPFPTLKHLEALSRFSSADALLAHARTADVRPVLPRVIRDGAAARTVLPGEPGYEPGVG